jgi:hypothetical protein
MYLLYIYIYNIILSNVYNFYEKKNLSILSITGTIVYGFFFLYIISNIL